MKLFLLVGATNLFSYQPQVPWGWGFPAPAKEIFRIESYKPRPGRARFRSLSDRLIGWYQSRVAPLQGARCPCFPSCSVFVKHSMKKYGFFPGLLMGIERLFFRENNDMRARLHYHSLKLGGKELVFDPPEANYPLLERDWRIILPRYHHLFRPR